MAKYNEILVGRFNRFLQKLTQLKGNAPAPQLAGEIVPSISLFSGAENRYLDSWDTYGAFIAQPAVAAQNGQIQFRNPSGSNVVAVVIKLNVFGVLADQPGLKVATTNFELATAVTLSANRFDNRSRPTPTLIASRTTVASPFVAVQYETAFAANGNVDLILADVQEFPLLPGDGLIIQSSVANQALNMSMWWRERYLEESERT